MNEMNTFTMYNTYQEAKIANPEKDISKCFFDEPVFRYFFTTKENALGIHIECGPRNYCMTLADFFDAGHKLVVGDSYENRFGDVISVLSEKYANERVKSDDRLYVLRAKALEDKMSEEIKMDMLKHIGLTDFSDKIEGYRKNALSAIKDAANKIDREDTRGWKNGDEIEVFNEDSEWVKARYVAFDSGMGYHVTFSDNGLEYALDSDIRELELEADKAKREAMEIIDSGNFDVTHGEIMAILDELSSAGMLKSRGEK